MTERNKPGDPMAPLKLVASKIMDGLAGSISSAVETIPFSASPAPTVPPMSREVKAAALGKLIEKWRMSQGWQPMTHEDHNATIGVWMEALDSARVEPWAYSDIYLAALQVRGSAMANGQVPQTFGPELFISLWPSIRDKREREAVDGGRQIPEVAMSACPLCNGCGFEVVEGKGARRCPNGCKVPL